MIIYLKRSIDIRWLFDLVVLLFILRWSCSLQMCLASGHFLPCEIQLMSQAYYYKPDGPILPAPWGILVMHAMWNMVCSSWVFSNGEAHRSQFFSPWSLIVKRRNISAQAHRQTVEEIIAGSRRWNRVRSFFNFWGHYLTYVIAEPSNQRLESRRQLPQ